MHKVVCGFFKRQPMFVHYFFIIRMVFWGDPVLFVLYFHVSKDNWNMKQPNVSFYVHLTAVIIFHCYSAKFLIITTQSLILCYYLKHFIHLNDCIKNVLNIFRFWNLLLNITKSLLHERYLALVLLYIFFPYSFVLCFMLLVTIISIQIELVMQKKLYRRVSYKLVKHRCLFLCGPCNTPLDEWHISDKPP